jgi:predicted N-formylglutamate amidohydrolase
VLIELRHDGIEAAAGQRLWAERLAPMLAEAAGTGWPQSEALADG